MSEGDPESLLKQTEKDKQISLSDKDLLALVDGQAKVVMYQDLHKFNNITELLMPYGGIFLLYQASSNFGHWVTVFTRNDTIEFFDPYGLFPDSELKWTDPDKRAKLNMDHTYMLKLLYEAPSNYHIVYNDHKFQKMDSKTNTCGRWAALRLHYRNLTLEQFTRKFDLKKTSTGVNDDIVTMLTDG